jgi:hypothetical protein
MLSPNLGESIMRQSDFLTPDQLAILSKAIDAHCAAHGIDDPDTREQVASRALYIHQAGIAQGEDDIQAWLADNVTLFLR